MLSRFRLAARCSGKHNGKNEHTDTANKNSFHFGKAFGIQRQSLPIRCRRTKKTPVAPMSWRAS
jgi:hypothetical protein